MSINEQKKVKRFLNLYCTAVALVVSIICGLLVFYTNYNKMFEYPEEEYQRIDELLKQIVDANYGIIKYNLKVPENIRISFDAINNKPSIKIGTTYENEIHIYSYACFNEDGKLVLERNFNNKEKLNNHYKNVGILFAFLIGTICFLEKILLSIPIKKYVISLGTHDEYEAVKKSYLNAGKNVKVL